MRQTMGGDQLFLFNKQITKPIITCLQGHHLFTPVAIITQWRVVQYTFLMPQKDKRHPTISINDMLIIRIFSVQFETSIRAPLFRKKS